MAKQSSDQGKNLEREISIPILPDHIITNEILLKLPAKSLLIFRCVSRSWCSLISSSEFIKEHLTNSKSSIEHQMLLLCNTYHHGKFKHCSFPSLFRELVVDACDREYVIKFPNLEYVDSCNGLICLVSDNKTSDNKTVILWNPSILKLKTSSVVFEGISDYTNYYGFGYDKSSDDYKVVCFQYMRGYFAVRIYSLKTDQWKSIKNYEGDFGGIEGHVITYANGKIYWIVRPALKPKDPGFISFKEWNIGYLDLETEEYGLLVRPKHVKRGVFFSRLFASQDCLHALCHDLCGIDIWVVENWKKVANIRNGGTFMTGGMRTNKALVYITRKENAEILFNSGERVVIFNPNNRLLRYPVIGNPIFHCNRTITYVDSLVSPLI